MNWFWFALITLVCWSGSDLFSKLGCYDEDDKTAHLKMVIAVGAVMGLHALYMVLFQGVEISWAIIWRYLPVSLLYIVSMALGYIGLRYIELSVSSPICNSSGAIVALLCIFTGGLSSLEANPVAVLCAVGLVCFGVIGLGMVEAREDEELRARRQEHANRKYAKSWLAICLPIAYCLLDATGTFADSLVLETLNEDSANVAYELTFFAAGVLCLAYFLLVRGGEFKPKQERPKYLAAIFETGGQLAYIYALADEEHVMLSAPIISAYCVLSAVWGRIFLKEKLSWKHYLMIALVVVGIVILGIFDI